MPALAKRGQQDQTHVRQGAIVFREASQGHAIHVGHLVGEEPEGIGLTMAAGQT
jgi:hypothetical protein